MTSSHPILDAAAQIDHDFTHKFNSLGAGIVSSKDVEELRIAFLGRKGRLQELFEALKTCDAAERPLAGKTVNLLRKKIEEGVAALQNKSASAALTGLVNKPALDTTLPIDQPVGSLHPISLMRNELLHEFRRLGFTYYEGPEIDLDFYNFSALNFPSDHPARDMQDTFFVSEPAQTVLRTHTSNIQIHAMLNESPPLRIVAMGRTFRCDSDMTHTPMFHQIEAVVVDQNISFAHLKGVIEHFLKSIFGQNITTRLRPSFFPFVEPGAEVDMQCVKCGGKGCRLCKDTGWLEVGGCGMIHPNVFEAVGYDSERFTGFAFGFGIDRLAMLKYSLSDLRTLFEGDFEFLNQFPVYSV